MKHLSLLLVLFLFTLAFGGVLPDTTKTPGDTVGNVMLMELCNPDFLIGQPISSTTRATVLKRYGLTEATSYPYILDLLIPCNLGGSSEVKNVWPQPRKGDWSYWKKNELEKKLNYLVCNAKLSVKEARHIIVSDWITAYKVFVLQDTTVHFYY